MAGLSFAERLPYIFKPLVLLVFLGAYAFQLGMVLVTLRPVRAYLERGEEYGLARIAAIKLPWRIVMIQTGTWVLGTTAYFIATGLGCILAGYAVQLLTARRIPLHAAVCRPDLLCEMEAVAALPVL